MCYNFSDKTLINFFFHARIFDFLPPHIINKPMIIFRYIALLAIVVLTACAKEVAPYEITLDETTPKGTVTAGGFVVIKLKGNSTTGYVWSITKDGTPCLRFKKEQYDGTDPKLIGSGGITSFIFDATKRGTVKVEFKYGRTWELSSEKTAEFEIRVL